MKRESEVDDQKSKEDDSAGLLCASCDRCRARKTRCDGQRPCSNCCARYMKAHKLSSLDGVDPNEMECVFSPAKKRGPVPGRTGLTRRIIDGMQESANTNTTGMGSGSSTMQQQVLSGGGGYDEFAMRQVLLQQQGLSGFRASLRCR
ncbi:hypothetical protein MHU86_7583 [Fragilaria crotonensis]|nr:hypothetical protein MHU86_7583 [Fragilaria crotonensis]